MSLELFSELSLELEMSSEALLVVLSKKLEWFLDFLLEQYMPLSLMKLFQCSHCSVCTGSSTYFHWTYLTLQWFVGLIPLFGWSCLHASCSLCFLSYATCYSQCCTLWIIPFSLFKLLYLPFSCHWHHFSHCYACPASHCPRVSSANPVWVNLENINTMPQVHWKYLF